MQKNDGQTKKTNIKWSNEYSELLKRRKRMVKWETKREGEQILWYVCEFCVQVFLCIWTYMYKYVCGEQTWKKRQKTTGQQQTYIYWFETCRDMHPRNNVARAKEYDIYFYWIQFLK